MALLRRPSIQLNKSLTALKFTFYENAQKKIFELEIWQRIKYFLLRQARSTISPLSEHTRTMRLLLRPSVQLNKSLTALKFTLYENAQKQILSSKSDNVLSTFYSDQLDQQLALHQNLLGLWHSYVDPQFNWTSPWLHWNSLFMKTHKKKFLSSKSDNVLSTFYSDKLDQQLALYQNLLGLWDSYLDPQFNWTSPWLHWNSLYMKTHKNKFWARNLTTYWVLFTQTS